MKSRVLLRVAETNLTLNLQIFFFLIFSPAFVKCNNNRISFKVTCFFFIYVMYSTYSEVVL